MVTHSQFTLMTIGINLDYFTDDDNYLKPAIRTADALKAMGVKYLRYPGGNKSDFYFFSVPPYEESIPTLARTGKEAVGGRHKMLKDYSEFAVDVLDFDEFMEMNDLYRIGISDLPDAEILDHFVITRHVE